MKYLFLSFIFLINCNVNAQEDNSNNQFVKAYVVVIDTSQNYFQLKKEMLILHENLRLKIDTLERSFNSKKNLICLPENSIDDIYAGDYYPRRSFSETLSLEYLNLYDFNNHFKEKTIALITILTNDKHKANINLTNVKKIYPNAYLLETEVYTGCLH